MQLRLRLGAQARQCARCIAISLCSASRIILSVARYEFVAWSPASPPLVSGSLCHRALRARTGVFVLAQAALAPRTPPTVDEARAFIARAEETLNTLGVRASRADWVQSTYITSDTQAIAAETREAQIRAATQFAKEAARFRDLQLPPDLARKLMLLRLQLTMPAPADPGELAELTRIATSLEADYGKGTYCRPGKDGTQECLDITAIERIMAESRDPKELAGPVDRLAADRPADARHGTRASSS